MDDCHGVLLICSVVCPFFDTRWVCAGEYLFMFNFHPSCAFFSPQKSFCARLKAFQFLSTLQNFCSYHVSKWKPQLLANWAQSKITSLSSCLAGMMDTIGPTLIFEDYQCQYLSILVALNQCSLQTVAFHIHTPIMGLR